MHIPRLMDEIKGPSELMIRLKDVARSMGIIDVGVASVNGWLTDPMVSVRIKEGHRPTDLMPDAHSVIVIGIPVQDTILDTAPSIYYSHLYGVVNDLLDHASERLTLELNALGFRAVYVPRDGYAGLSGLRDKPESFFSHRHAAYLAGMGTFGWNNMLLTEKYGPRIRFASIITSAELPYGEVMTDDLCIGCRKCTRNCPVSAVGSSSYPTDITKKDSCTEEAARLAQYGKSPCGRCIAVCPVGRNKGVPPTDSAVDVIRSYGKSPKQ